MRRQCVCREQYLLLVYSGCHKKGCSKSGRLQSETHACKSRQTQISGSRVRKGTQHPDKRAQTQANADKREQTQNQRVVPNMSKKSAPISLCEVSPACLPHSGGLRHQNSSLLAPMALARRPESINAALRRNASVRRPEPSHPHSMLAPMV